MGMRSRERASGGVDGWRDQYAQPRVHARTVQILRRGFLANWLHFLSDGMPAANEYFSFRAAQDFKPGAPKHSFDTGSVGYPPVRRVARIAFFDKIHPRKSIGIKDGRFRKRIII